MTLNAKWTAVSFFALAAMGAASVAFAGCTVTSGKVDDVEAGPGTNTDAGKTDSPSGKACPGNTKQTTTFINATCQSAMETACCAELTTCFDIVPDQDAAAGGTDDCNKYSQCIPKCRFKIDGTTPETDEAKISACQDDCDLAAPKSVVDAYTALTACVTNHPATNTACQ
ncbi:hypothetical protein BH11MYX4_BH11MYX4_31540 [soil metagenome]